MLGIRPGFEALERVVGDHVELYFVPPPHRRSLKGRLAKVVRRKPRGSFSSQRRKAWTAAAREKTGKSEE